MGGGNPFGGGGRGGGPEGFSDFFGNMGDIFEEVMRNGGGGQRRRGGNPRSSSSPGDDLRYDIRITLEEAFPWYKNQHSI